MDLGVKKVCLKRIKLGDQVQVITGKFKGRRGNVIKVDRYENLVSIAGLNMKVHHNKGEIVTKEAPIHASNVMLIDPTTDKPGKVGFKVMENGEKYRVFRKTGHQLGLVSKKADNKGGQK